MRRVAVLAIASALGLGYVPIVPGTWGTLPGIPIFLLTSSWQAAHPGAALLSLVAFIAAACLIAHEAEKVLRRHDARNIVIDEVAGYLAASFLLPGTLRAAVVAFVCFRVLDVLKPWPAGLIDRRLPGGAGVVLDDVASGVYANLITRLLLAWWA